MTESSSGAWSCGKCRNDAAPRIGFKPWTGALGRRIQDTICLNCWNEWTSVQTKIINEYRLNVLDPGHAKALREQMEVFFEFRAVEGDDGAR